MADFESIIKNYCNEDGSISAEAITKLTKAISTTVGNEFVEKMRYKAKLEEIDTLKAEKQTAEDSAVTAEKWKEKYEALEKNVTAKETKSAKENAYRNLLKAAGVGEDYIDDVLSVTNIDFIEIDKNGKIKNADDHTEKVKAKFPRFIETKIEVGADTPKPPANNGGSKFTKEDIYKKDDKGRYVMSNSERQKAIAEIISRKD